MSLSSNAHFSKAPSVKINRSVFDRSHGYKSTWNNGSLIPIMWDLILPGDSVSLDLSTVVRMSTPIKPIMDNVVMDTFFFFVPLRLLDKYFEKVMGGLDSTDVWKPAVEHTVPQIEFPHTSGMESWFKIIDLSKEEFDDYKLHMFTNQDYVGKYIYKRTASSTPGKYSYIAVSSSDTYSASAVYCNRYGGWGPGSLADYLGLPIGASPIVDTDGSVQSVMQYPFRAYCKVWNEFFRDQNYMLPVDDHFDDPTTIEGRNYRQGDWSSDSDTNPQYSNYDYITDTVKGAKPLRVSRFHDAFSSVLPQPQRGDATPIPMSGSAPIFDAGGSSFVRPTIYGSANGLPLTTPHYLTLNSSGKLDVDTSSTIADADLFAAKLSLAADLSQIVSPSTINDLRTAFQLQKFSETYAMSGTRYIEIIRGFFGVINPDYRLQRPEYLGGSRKYLNISQVLQTSSTDTITPQGNTAAYSLTTDKEGMVRKSFTEHGILLGLVCCRTHRSYQSGFNRMWEIKRKYDFPWPQFSHLSNVPVYNKELFCYGDWINNGGTPKSVAVAYNTGVFGYQERYFEYRYFPDIVTSSFVSQGPTPLDFWHFADYYQNPVYASMDWLLEGPENLDRCLAVTSQQADQFLGDFYFKYIHTRPLPAYGIPGLADHF